MRMGIFIRERTFQIPTEHILFNSEYLQSRSLNNSAPTDILFYLSKLFRGVYTKPEDQLLVAQL